MVNYSDLFSTYYGGEIDLHVIFGTGYKRLFNRHGISIKGWNGGAPGIGLSISYMEMSLSPGLFVPGKETIITGITRSQQVGGVVETKNVELNSLLTVRVPN